MILEQLLRHFKMVAPDTSLLLLVQYLHCEPYTPHKEQVSNVDITAKDRSETPDYEAFGKEIRDNKY